MPRVERDGTGLYYETDGEGETVCFVGDLGYGAWQWGWQHAALAGPYETLTWDLRGTGRSDVPEGPYSVDDLAADLEAVLSAASPRGAHLIGAGLGGMVALRYALDYDRARSLALLGTAAGGPHRPENPPELYAPPDDPAALRETLWPVLTETFFVEQPSVVDGIVRWRAGVRPEVAEAAEHPDELAAARDGGDATGDGWRAQAAAVEAFDCRDRLHEITDPALVVHGTADGVWPPAGGEALAEGLPRGRYEPVEGGPHLVGVEYSRIVNDLLSGFLADRTRE
jgi:pimeloyl-ACP methyl ester carboxylesterase